MVDTLGLAALIELARDGRSNGDIARDTIGADPDRPGEPAISHPRVQQLAAGDLTKAMATPPIIRGLAQALRVPPIAVCRANLVTLGIPPGDRTGRAAEVLYPDTDRLPPEELRLLRIVSQYLVRHYADS